MHRGFLTAGTPQDELRYLYSLADFDDEGLVLRTCEFVMTDAVKTQNAPFVLRLAIANRRHGPAAWKFIRQHVGDRQRNRSRRTRSSG